MNNFEELYIAARRKEGRLYTIEQIRKLPYADKKDPLAKEWALRLESAARFAKYLRENKFSGPLLEIGCGNGWFCNFIVQNTSKIPVSGQDINQFELRLASLAFTDPRLSWISEDAFSVQQKFKLVVFNSSIHYFPGLGQLLAHVSSLLEEGGEIHIMDSPFYRTTEELKKARERTKDYYTKLGFPALSEFYTPHLYSDLEKFDARLLYDPGTGNTLLNKLAGKKKNPFPWFRIQNNF